MSPEPSPTDPLPRDPLRTGPPGAGPLPADPPGAGPSPAGPLRAGPLGVGSSPAGPLRAGSLPADPLGAGRSPAVPLRAGPSSGDPLAAGPLLAAVEVVRSFGETPALRGADLEVAAGEIVAVMGPSGSGKSTLLHCLAGILRPDSGEVVFDGRRVDRMTERDRTLLRRDRFGFVFQFGQLVPELPAVENVMLPLLLSGATRPEARVRAAELFARLRLDGLQERRPGELSGGQAQRVAVARALVSRPAVIFADEPTGSLDSLSGDRVMDLLVGAAREQGTTVVVVTHEARVAASADREVVVRDGRVTRLVAS